jgi:hypothetical protein
MIVFSKDNYTMSEALSLVKEMRSQYKKRAAMYFAEISTILH